jgi:hypothetical protein
MMARLHGPAQLVFAAAVSIQDLSAVPIFKLLLDTTASPPRRLHGPSTEVDRLRKHFIVPIGPHCLERKIFVGTSVDSLVTHKERMENNSQGRGENK